MICMQQMTKLTTKSWLISALTIWTMTKCFRVRLSSSPYNNNSQTMSKGKLIEASGSKSSVRMANSHSLVFFNSASHSSSSMDRSSLISKCICSKKETLRVMKSARSSCKHIKRKWKVMTLIGQISNSLLLKMRALKTRKSRCQKSESRTLRASCSSRRVKTTKKVRFIYSSSFKMRAKSLTKSTKTLWV